MYPYQIVAEQRARAEGGFPNLNRKPPMWVLDRIAEEKLHGGYTRKKNPVCHGCFVRKSVTGSCNCTVSD